LIQLTVILEPVVKTHVDEMSAWGKPPVATQSIHL
jgi:hypothetical protein